MQTDEVRFDVSGTLRNVSSQVLVPGRKIAAPQLAVTASNSIDRPALEITGKGQFDGIPFEAQKSLSLDYKGAPTASPSTPSGGRRSARTPPPAAGWRARWSCRRGRRKR